MSKLFLCLVAAVPALAYSDRGILKLDNTTFDRIVDGTKAVFVRFDKEYPYGDEHDAWKSFAAKVGDSSADMLVADVSVSEYGDKDNSDIAERFDIKSDAFPQYRLWKAGMPSAKEPMPLKTGKTEEEFLRFVQAEVGVWIGLPGQVKELDAIARDFKAGKTAAALKAAEKAAKKMDAKDADSTKYYIKVMTKGKDDAGFVTKEAERLKKMIGDASVKANKKEQFGRRLNILSSFQ